MHSELVAVLLDSLFRFILKLKVLCVLGGSGADTDKRVGCAGHHLPGAERHDFAYCREPCSQLPGTATTQQEPQSIRHKVRFLC